MKEQTNKKLSSEEDKVWIASKIKRADDFCSFIFERINYFFTARRILTAAVVLLVLHWSISLFFNYQIYRDVAGVYAWYARDFGNGIWQGEPISKVPPLNIFLGGLLVRCGVEAYSSVIAVSLLFMALTLFPLYRMLKLWMPERSAALGCLLFVFAPGILRFSGTGLLESGRDFFLVSAFYLLFRSWNKGNKFFHWCLFGGALGLLMLARGEGGVMAGLIGLLLFIQPVEVWRSGKKIFQNILGPVLISGVCALAVITPTLYQNYTVTGYPVTDARMISVVSKLPVIKDCFTAKKAKSKDVRVLPHERKSKEHYFSWKNNSQRLKELPRSVSRGAYEPYLILVVLGIILTLKAGKWRKEYWVLSLFCLCIPACLFFFSVSHRYFIFFIPLLMVFTLAGLKGVIDFAERYHSGKMLAVLCVAVLMCLPLKTWLWMIDRSDWDELNARAFIEKNRSRFLPENSKRKLIIHGDPRIVFRCGEERLFHYGEHFPEAQYITGFDLLFVRKKDKEELAGCLKRRDLRQIEAPFRRFAVFAPIERKK